MIGIMYSPYCTLLLINTAPSNMIGLIVRLFFLQNKLQKYNRLQPPYVDACHHGGHNFFLLSCTSLCVSVSCSILGGGIPSHNSVYKSTRICPSIVLSCYLVFPALIPGPLSLPVPSPPSRFAPHFLPTMSLLSPLPPPSPILPYLTTEETTIPWPPIRPLTEV